MDTNPVSCMVSEIISLIHLGVMILTIWGSGDVIDHVTIGCTIYGSIVASPLSCTVSEV